ncbi:MAG: multidrug effflux MFS transporter [Propionibacteriaceae bacterium]|nr:multidrug effflux MFS transporter [Propionibacteriaceae bacterium]
MRSSASPLPAAAAAPDASSPGAAGSPSLAWTVLAAVVLVSGIAPLATDMYVPAFPVVGADLAATASQVQLTLTTFFVGMALGQLVGGPVSDARGRRRPLLVSLVVLTAASVACALAPSIGWMLAARFVQGLAGGWAMVTARAVVVDLARGAGLVRSLNLVAGVGGIAPIVGPLLGGVILQFSGWRVSFWIVAALGAAMVLAVLASVPESLPEARRHRGGLVDLVRPVREVVSHRRFVAFLIVNALSMGVIFAYVATSAFILQTMNGLTPIEYSLDFAANAVGLAAATLLAAHLAGRVRTETIIGIGVALTGAAGLALLVGALWLELPLWLAIVAFFVLMSAQGFIGPNAGALASDAVPHQPGTGSAVLGFLQWTMAGLIAPLTGIGGDTNAVPMAVIILALTGVSVRALVGLARPRAADAGGVR